MHELGHWTGHKKRLDRDLSGRFGSAAYAMEELRAELASAFIGVTMGLPTDIPQHASYIASWIEKLKDDKREIFRAAADAQKIADMALGFHPDYAMALQAERAQTSETNDFPGRGCWSRRCSPDRSQIVSGKEFRASRPVFRHRGGRTGRTPRARRRRSSPCKAGRWLWGLKTQWLCIRLCAMKQRRWCMTGLTIGRPRPCEPFAMRSAWRFVPDCQDNRPPASSRQ